MQKVGIPGKVVYSSCGVGNLSQTKHFEMENGLFMRRIDELCDQKRVKTISKITDSMFFRKRAPASWNIKIK